MSIASCLAVSSVTLVHRCSLGRNELRSDALSVLGIIIERRHGVQRSSRICAMCFRVAKPGSLLVTIPQRQTWGDRQVTAHHHEPSQAVERTNRHVSLTKDCCEQTPTPWPHNDRLRPILLRHLLVNAQIEFLPQQLPTPPYDLRSLQWPCPT